MSISFFGCAARNREKNSTGKNVFKVDIAGVKVSFGAGLPRSIGNRPDYLQVPAVPRSRRRKHQFVRLAHFYTQYKVDRDFGLWRC